MKAFVTGSTGLLGSNLVNLLVQQGWDVKALARSREKAQKCFQNAKVEIVVGDMEAIPSFAPSMAGCDVVFHVAAYFREYYQGNDDWEKLQKINIQGTVDICAEAEKHGVKKVIYVSSGGVIGKAANGISDETTAADEGSQANSYFKSKVLAEKALDEFLKTHPIPVVLILPTAMVGPQDAAPTAMGQGIVDMIDQKFPVIPPGGFEFVDARDVAQAMIDAVERGKSGERYLISNGFLTMEAVVQYVGKVTHIKMPTIVFPYPIMLRVASLLEFFAKLQGKTPRISGAAVRAMNHIVKVNNAKGIRELGATYRPFEDTFRDTAQWFISNGYPQSQR